MSPIKMEKIESGVRAVISFINEFNSHNVDGLLKLFAEKCIIEDYKHLSIDSCNLGKEQIAAYYRSTFDNFLESKLEVIELIGFGMRVILRWKLAWTDGQGKAQAWYGLSLFRLSQAKICEILEYVKDHVE